MTAFDDHFVPAADQLDDFHGEPVTRHPAGGGSDVTLTARWSPGEVLTSFYPDASQKVAAGVLRIQPSAAAGWNLDDEFTVRGEKYAVLAVGAPEPSLELQLGRRTSERIGSEEHVLRR